MDWNNLSYASEQHSQSFAEIEPEEWFEGGAKATPSKKKETPSKKKEDEPKKELTPEEKAAKEEAD